MRSSMDSLEEDPDELREESRASIERVRDLVGDLKVVQEHENAVLEDEPLIILPPAVAGTLSAKLSNLNLRGRT